MATKRANPTPRGEGMGNIVAATIRLLETQRPQDITLRDVARESGHGHRLIVEWFGGKGGLFAAVFREIFAGLVETGELFNAGVVTRTDVRTAFQIFNYMQIHHPDFVMDARDDIVRTNVKERLMETLNMTPADAEIATSRIALVALGVSLFREFFDLSDDEVVRLMQDTLRTTTGLNPPDSPNINR